MAGFKRTGKPKAGNIRVTYNKTKLSCVDAARGWFFRKDPHGLVAFPTPWGWYGFLDIVRSGQYSDIELERIVRNYWVEIGYVAGFEPAADILDRSLRLPRFSDESVYAGTEFERGEISWP